MRVSDNEVKKVLSRLATDANVEASPLDSPEMDRALAEEVALGARALADRADRIADLKARLAEGTYRPSAEAIVDSMVRRSIADQAG